MPTVASLVANISVTGASAAAGALSGVGLSAEQAGGMLKNFALAGVAVAAAALTDLVVHSVQMAGDFQSSMTRLVTSAGELGKNLPMISAGILKMSVDTATGTDQLAKGMYYVESAGNHGAAALAVLGVAARGAKTENADLDVVAKALTTTMTDYHMPVSQAASAMNGLILTVQNGKTNLQDLSSAMGRVLPIASSLGISFPQVAGAMDTMTNAGQSSNLAATNLAHVLVALQSPSGVATKAMDAVGLSAQQVKDTLVNKGLPEALQLIEDHVGQKFPKGSVEGVTALKDIMGGLVGLKTAAMLTGGSLKETEDNIAKITKGMKDGANAVLGWSDVQGNFNFKLDQAKQVANSFMITLGTELLPIFGKLLDQITPMIAGFISWETKTHGVENAVKSLVDGIVNMVNVGVGIVKFFKDNEVAGSALEAVLVVLAGVGIMLMIQSLVALAVTVGAATIAMLPMIATIALVSLAVLGIILLIKNWGAIMDWLTGKTKESQLQQQELNEKNKLKTIQSAEEQKRGVLANMEDERTQLIAKIKGMADGADKSREQIRLSALNAQIATTQGDLKELDKEKTQHLATLKQLQAQDPQIREQTKIAAIQKQVDTKNGVLKQLDEEKTQLIAKILNEKDGSAKNRDLMKLDAINKQIATTDGAIKALDSEKTQHAAKLKDMVASDLEARKGWYDRANDATTAWFSSWNGIISRGYAQANNATTVWVNTQQAHLGEMIGSWISNLGRLANFITSWCGQTIGGWMSWLGSLVSTTGAKLEAIPGIVSQALAQAAAAAYSGGISIVGNIASGIEASIGSVINAIGDVAGAIAAHLPHSPAKMGPLVGLEDMGANISKQLASGMSKSIPTIKAAMNVMLSPIASSATNSSGVPMSSQQGITVIVNPPNLVLDGQRLTNAQLPYIVQGIRVATGMIV